MDITTYCTRELLNAIPKYQMQHIKNLLKNHDENEAFDIWINANGPSLTVPHGGDQSKKDLGEFKKALRAEFKKFVCDDPKYSEENKKLFNYKEDGKTYIVSIVSTAIAPYVGSSATMLVPLVAILLLALGKIGKNAWCTLD